MQQCPHLHIELYFFTSATSLLADVQGEGVAHPHCHKQMSGACCLCVIITILTIIMILYVCLFIYHNILYVVVLIFSRSSFFYFCADCLFSFSSITHFFSCA